MPTLLVTAKMSPELQGRVEASVSGRPAGSRRSLAPLARGLFRIGIVTTMVLAVSLFAAAKKRARAELEADRAELLVKVRREAVSLTAAERGILSRVEPWLLRSAGPYAGDAIAADLRGVGAVATVLGRPTVYVRGPVDSFARPVSVETASASFSDAFVLCLLDPPASHNEKVLLARARSALAGGERLERVASHVSRLQHALLGLPFLAPAFEARVVGAESARELAELDRAFRRAPLAGARAAAKAELLLFAMDEAGDRSQPAELDGERAHVVRVGLVDLTAGKILFGLRRRVDPSGLSATARAEYASGIDACALGLDVREAIAGDKPLGS